ncbi:lipoprotein NlpI [Paraburkholderia caballeronis]|nr:lipoprotein NlpI [Paraburkholderia caballeronis]
MSVDVLSDALKLIPDSVTLRPERAFDLEQLGDYTSAIADYRAILETNPNDMLARRYMADDETTLGRYDDAARDYEIVSRSAPSDGGLLSGRAQLNFYTGDFLQADVDLSKWQYLYRKGKLQQVDELQPYYVAIWRHIIALKLSTDDTTRLSEQVRGLESNRWPYPILALYMGRSTVAELLSAVGNSVKDHDNRLCEINAYLGEWLLARDDRSGARQNFEAASLKCPANFIEKELARRELQWMSQAFPHVAAQSSNYILDSQSMEGKTDHLPSKGPN